MPNTKFTPGMWRIDPQNRSQVLDRFGRVVAAVSPDGDSNVVVAAPDMFEVLQKLEESKDSIPQALWEEIQLVLRRARGDFGMAYFSRLQASMSNEEWLKFIESLWQGPPPAP